MTDWRTASLSTHRSWTALGYRPLFFRLHRHIDERIAWARLNQPGSGRLSTHSAATRLHSPPMDFWADLATEDPEIAQVVRDEEERSRSHLELIASESYPSLAVLQATGSILTGKYAEGYPGRRYYGGCEVVDVAENLARDRAKELFGAEHANVQPHAGAQANMAVYHALLERGDTVMGLALDQGGHLTHGSPVNFSGQYYNFVAYHVDRETHLIDMDEVAALAREHRPKMIVTGATAYPRIWDFAALPRDCRRGRRHPDDRYGPLRRAGGGRRAPIADPASRRS